MGAWNRFAGAIACVIAVTFVAASGPSCSGETSSHGGSGGLGGKTTTSSSSTTSTTTQTGGAGGGCGEVQQTPGDCKKNVCEGSDVKGVPDDADLPDDGNECTLDTCAAGEVTNTPVAAGGPCTQGGKVCDGKGACVACVANGDCGADEVCTKTNQCVAASCTDGVKNGGETDVDCGGPCLGTCAPGQACVGAEDCLQGVCKAHTCLVPTCGDAVKNGDETDVDCGGTCASAFFPKKCAEGKGCVLDADCKGGACSGTVCLPSCIDGVLNNGETTIDCGGPNCPPCGDGDKCAADGDCSSGHCVSSVCCDTACTADCSACSAATKTSGADGVCGPAKVGAPCGPASQCAAGQTDVQDTCDGQGACVDQGQRPCAPYACGAATCKTTCADDTDCQSPATCVASACVLGVGAPCAAGKDCVSGSCADGVCCDDACAGVCRACTAAKKGSGADGACGDVLTGTDPDDECLGALNCGAGKCQIGSGKPCTDGAECVTGNCVDGVCCNGPCTGTCQACTTVKKGAGSDGSCGPIAANTDPDDECTGSAACNGAGACALSVNGQPCAADGECQSAHCVDGVCCNTGCTGTCIACSASKKGSGLNGLCGPIASGTDPDNECPSGTVCATGGCKLPDAAHCASNVECMSGYCADGVCCNNNCIGTCQACTAAKKGSGADGICGPIAVGTDPDDECGGPTTCSGAGSCALKTAGSTCASAVECSTGFCADGVCCDTACAGVCSACTAAKKGSGTDGTCGPLPAGTDPDDECAGTTACNGSSGCALLPNGTTCTISSECTSGFCADGVCCNTSCTSTCNACTAVKKGQGTDGTCGYILIGTDPDSECPGVASCNGVGNCGLLANGIACSQDQECSSGFCVDGVCCNTVCNSTCNACTAAKKGSGSNGTCGTIASGADPDNECPGAEVCNGSGVCKLPAGAACTAATDCLSSYCVDGVCCNTACNTACQACTAIKKGSGVDGTCAPIASGTDPDNECGGAASCNGSGACALFAAGVACAVNAECSSGYCVDGVCCNSACNTTCQACTAAKKGSGTDGTCGSIASGADPDNECAGTQICNGSGACKAVLGDVCTQNTDCLSNYCADGVCCNTACNTTCQACTAAKKGSGADGTCANIAAGSDPDNECFGAYTCNGSGACALLATGATCTSGNECTSGFCVDGVCCNTACNALCNACTALKKGSGTDGTCGTISAGTDPDNECPGTQVCNASGSCKGGTGDACVLATDCSSSYCVDGVCCNATCSGTCQACTAAKKGSGPDGTCANIPAGADPDNECFGGISCNGAGACGFLAAGTACTANGECASGYCVDGVCCNTACNTLCNACTAVKKGSGADGTCGLVGANMDPDNECAGTLVCNGSGACKGPNGDACSLGTDCVSGYCADGVCCNTACNTTCQACTAVKKGSGADGTCASIPAGSDPDGECFGGISCNGAGACAFLAAGAACTANGECSSGFCVDGVCCNTACNTLCNACTAVKKGSGADGTCGLVGANMDPDNECAGTLVCNGSGACKGPLGDTCAVAADCVSGFCADGVCCSAACTGTCQACTAAKKGSGADGTCANIGAGTDPDNECFGGISCNGAGACSFLAAGAACTANGECSSGFCVDGVCCNSACNTLCNACTAVKKGSGTDGTCGVIASGLDPDNECAGTAVCNGASLCKSPNGDACTQASDCVSNFCADGVCCNAACTGACQACTAIKKGSGPDGTCGNIPIGTDPDNECLGAIACSGAGACSLLAAGATCAANAECSSGFCVDGVCCNSACNTLCNACTAAKKGSGADGTCGVIAANLDPDNECPGTQVCNGASVCKSPNADACLLSTDCVSGFCADGVCCSTACSGACQACTATKKGSGADGVCGNIAIGTDPDNECFGAYSCNGAGACAMQATGGACAANAECASGYCVDGVCCNTACNTLCNACTAVKKGSGTDGTCAAIAAGLDPDAECAGALVCNGASLCKVANGDACALGTDCVSGACVDGVCCNTTCTGTCNACTAAKKGSGLDGVCGAIGAGLDPDNECGGAASCNGASACALFAAGTACAVNAECSSGYCVDGVCCNTACNTLCNACTAAKKNSGADGTCGVIPSGLDPDNECPGAASCNGASACALFAAGTACSINAECANGNCVDGFCCNTACTGTCQACSTAKKGSGANGTCGNVATNTDPDNECPGATSCNAVAACGLFANGFACTQNAECTSGSCVDGVCCNTACGGLCQACVGTKTSVSDGTCADVVPGTDPDNECSDATSSPHCGGNLTCGP